MRVAFAFVLAAHALLHLLGFLKAFGRASLPQLTIPISRGMGLVWLAAAILLLAATTVLVVSPRWFWLVALAGIATSQVAIVSSWHDARFGTIVNIAALVLGLYAAVAWGPFGLRLSRALHG